MSVRAVWACPKCGELIDITEETCNIASLTIHRLKDEHMAKLHPTFFDMTLADLLQRVKAWWRKCWQR